MSEPLTKWTCLGLILDAPDLPARKKTILIGLLRHSDEEFVSYPGAGRLARYAGCRKDTLWGHLRDLETDGLIQRASRGRGKTNTYRLNIQRLSQLPKLSGSRVNTEPVSPAELVKTQPAHPAGSGTGRPAHPATTKPGKPFGGQPEKPATNPSRNTSGNGELFPSSNLFPLDEQGAGLVRNGSAFKWLDPKTGESRTLSFQFIERLAPQEPRAILLDFAETELIAAIDEGREGGLHGLVRHAIDKGRLATFKRRRQAPVVAAEDREPEAAAPITEGSWE